MPAMIGSREIGGGYVRIRFSRLRDGLLESLAPGTPLTAAEIEAMANGRRLINTEHIAVYPPLPPGERHVVARGSKFDVIEGRKLNDRPMTKDEAEELATRQA